MSDAFTVVPANEASCEDLQQVLGTRGYAASCQCQRFKSRGREWDAVLVGVEERAFRLRIQTRRGQPDADTTSGLVAYLEGEPVGWCAVEPRTAYVRLGRVPLGRSSGRQERRRCLGRDLLHHPCRIPASRRHVRASSRGR